MRRKQHPSTIFRSARTGIDLLRKMDGWNADLLANEDFDLDYRIGQSGGLLLLDPAIPIRWKTSQRLRDFSYQYQRYGRGKAAVARLHPRSLKLRHLLPVAMFGTLGASVVLAAVAENAWFLLLDVPYLMFLLGSFSDRPFRTSCGRSPWLGPVVLFTMHMSWAWVTAGYHPDDPFSFESHEDFSAAVQRPISGMKIAYSRNLGIYPVEKVVSAHIDHAVRAFEEAGAIVEEFDPAINHSQQELSSLWCRMIAPNSLLGLERLRMQGFDLLRDHPEDLPPQFHHWLEIGRGLTALDALRDQVIRSQIFASIQKVFESHDLIVTPTLACMPVDNSTDGNTVGPTSINGEAVDPLIGWCMTYLFNFTGHPAASVPAGLSPDGLPIGLQIIGRRHSDSDVLAASAAFERVRPWRDDYRVVAEVLSR